ncbi:uncharacterized protein V1510DRAFT_416241 [Dipodascopsis tothii]|uniref:uncharacterized protein n=1 Tax=Dipodascopsis tothii TaxID=44089 RepID=UPI0034CFA74E
MIADLDADFAQSTVGQLVIANFESLGIEVSATWASPLGSMIKWRRKTCAEYNEALGYFVPIPEEIRREPFVFVYTTGVDFVEKVLDQTVDDDLARLGQHFPGMKVIYMIEGLHAFLGKVSATAQRAFASRVQEALGGSQRRRKEPAKAASSKESEVMARLGAQFDTSRALELVDDALLGLQVVHRCHIFHSTIPPDSAEWIAIMTQDMSIMPYRAARVDVNESICMEAGQIKAGADHRGTFQNTLQQLKFFSPAMANSVVNEFKTIDKMMLALGSGGPDRLLRICSNRGRGIGKTLARNLHFAFTSKDPHALLQ